MTRGNYVQIKADTREFTRKLKLREKFWDTHYTDESLVREKSHYNPKPANSDLEKIIEQIESTDPIETIQVDNLSTHERMALAEIKAANDIIIKKADKGNTLIVMDSEFYRNKLVITDHLNTNTYAKVDINCDHRVSKLSKLLMMKHKQCLTTKEVEYITDFDYKSSNFYVLPKIHKSTSIIEKVSQNNSSYIHMDVPNDLKGRPIVAGPSSPTHRLSELLDLILSPLVPHLKSYIKDDWDFLRKLPRYLPYECDLYSCDIVSLYTSISHELGLKATEYWISKFRHIIPVRFTSVFILESVDFVLKNNFFLFDNNLYQQLIGTAMGTGFAPPYACLTVGFLEVTRFYPELPLNLSSFYCEFITKLFYRFMDDGFIPWPRSLDINILKCLLNNLDTNIKYTLEPASQICLNNGNIVQRLNFLDIAVILHPNGNIETDIYYKPTNNHDYLDYESHHPIHIKNNIPFNLAKRIIVFCSRPEVEQFRLNELKNWLLNCNYPESLIMKAFHNAKLQGPAPAPLPKENTLPLVTTYFSNYSSQNVTQVTKRLMEESRSIRIQTVFGNTRTVLALRQPPNLLRQVSKAKFTTTPTISKPPGLYTCLNKRCELCVSYIQQCTSFITSNGTEWIIKCHINCHSKCVLYYLKCNSCNEVTYTGRTRHFRSRMNNHISDCRTGRTTDQFDIHVYNCNITGTEPFFKIYAFMEVTHEHRLLSYEKLLHRLQHDTMN